MHLVQYVRERAVLTQCEGPMRSRGSFAGGLFCNAEDNTNPTRYDPMLEPNGHAKWKHPQWSKSKVMQVGHMLTQLADNG